MKEMRDNQIFIEEIEHFMLQRYNYKNKFV
jgi:hypothetical protein